jgi:hypothetical protein
MLFKQYAPESDDEDGFFVGLFKQIKKTLQHLAAEGFLV